MGDKFDEEEFVQWLAEELVKNGCVIKVEQPVQKQETEEQPKEEVVVELDDNAYKDLQQKISQSIELLQSRKPEVLQIFCDIDNVIKDLGDLPDAGSKHDEHLKLIEDRDKEITNLVSKIKRNQELVDDNGEEQTKER